MTAPLSPHLSSPLTGDVILKSAQDIAVNCPWCQRLMRACDGALTLAELAQKVHLPLKVCEKLVTKAVQFNWMEVVSTEPQGPVTVVKAVAEVPGAEAAQIGGDFWFEVNQALHSSLGAAGVRLLQQAALMTRLNSGKLTGQEAGHFLIALELAASEEERLALNEHLDRLRARYAA